MCVRHPKRRNDRDAPLQPDGLEEIRLGELEPRHPEHSASGRPETHHNDEWMVRLWVFHHIQSGSVRYDAASRLGGAGARGRVQPFNVGHNLFPNRNVISRSVRHSATLHRYCAPRRADPLVIWLVLSGCSPSTVNWPNSLRNLNLGGFQLTSRECLTKWNLQRPSS